jgi:hypothetical protein
MRDISAGVLFPSGVAAVYHYGNGFFIDRRLRSATSPASAQAVFMAFVP